MAKDTQINWIEAPEAHNYPAAESYLRLLYDEARVADLVASLKAAPLAQFKAKDIFAPRSSRCWASAMRTWSGTSRRSRRAPP